MRPSAAPTAIPVAMLALAALLLASGLMMSAASPLAAVLKRVSDQRRALPLSPFEERGVEPGDWFRECDGCPSMVLVPAGEFLMGAADTEDGNTASERPRHNVRIARPFAVGRFAVTFDEWGACVADGGCRWTQLSDQGFGRGTRPVINIRWDEAKAYAWWLSQRTGRPYRLLSESEREYVTRAGTTTAFWWGDTIDPAQANYDGSRVGEYRAMTLPVESFAANPWGLHQVHGNVYDWVEDCWNETYDGAPSDGSAWTSGDCARRVLRGGSWNRAPTTLRAAARLGFGSDMRMAYFGLRVARTIKD